MLALLGSACGERDTSSGADHGFLPAFAAAKFGPSALQQIPLTFSYSGPPVAIPDADAAGVTVPLSVSGVPGTLDKVDLRFDGASCSSALGATNVGLEHGFVGDLQIALSSPAGMRDRFLRRRQVRTPGRRPLLAVCRLRRGLRWRGELYLVGLATAAASAVAGGFSRWPSPF